MKTIKELADELGVSKTAVNKKIDNLGLRSSLRKNGNQFAINKKQESLIKSEFHESKGVNQKANQSQTNSAIVDTLLKQSEILQRELEVKNKQIAEMQKLLDQEQQLRMAEHQKVLMLETKKKGFFKKFSSKKD